MKRREFIRGAVASVGVTLSEWKSWAANEGFPSYYAEQLMSVAERIVQNAQMGWSGFFFITDLHVKSNCCESGRLIAELVRRTGVRRVLCGGDFVEAFGERYPLDKCAVDYAIDRFHAKWVTPIRAAGGLLYTAKGNHDFTVRHSMKKEDGQRGFTCSGAESRRIIIGKWTEAGVFTNVADPNGCYYYFDDGSARIRYVVADTTDSEKSGDVAWGVVAGMHETQISWLRDVALGAVPSGFDVVVMNHIPLTDVVGGAGDARRYAPFRRVLEDFQAQGKGRVLVDLTGHEHAERQTFQNGILHVTEPCDAAYGDYIIGSAPWCGELPEKRKGTIGEQTFDVVQFSRDHRMVQFTRVGGGQDRTIHLGAKTIHVGERLKMSPEMLSGRLTFGCYDGDRISYKPNPNNRWNPLVSYKNEFATITETGVLVAHKPGPVMVVMRNEKFEKEILPVLVVGGKSEKVEKD